METASHPETTVQFEGFKLDLRTHELYQNGSRLKVRGHPVDVLAILLEHPGELVTRETLRKRLWPNDTFVDFEQILNNSVGKLRDAFGDNAESPHFIETLPRLGYRFIAPVNSNDANHSVPAPFAVPLDPTAPIAVPVPQLSALKRRILWMAIGLTCAICAVAYWYLRSPSPTLQVTY